MNYGIRNTLILTLALVLFTGGGWLVLHLTYASKVVELEETREQREQDIAELAEVAGLYDHISMEYARQVHIRENHPKELLTDNRAGRLYDYLQQLNRGISFTELNYSVRDSVLQDDYGYLNLTIDGEGYYRNLYNFIYRIEHGSPIIKIESVEIRNITELERLSRVQFRMTLQAYYNRDDRLDYTASLILPASAGNVGHNPFYPLIHPVPPNTRGLVDVDQSSMVGMTTRYILVEDQGGAVRRLSVGDPVYLGHLQRIDTGDQRAVFQLNRGGIVDRVTLNLE
ncbi:hypothetical protein QA596_12100 [Balneolales bacterium ANBcel1]|nr:hypothetical protein [Balneolales bacterium ANBcel1]